MFLNSIAGGRSGIPVRGGGIVPRIGLHPGPTCFTRPNRSRAREFSANDVARLYCRQLRDGIFTHQEFIDAVDARCGWPRSDDWRKRVQDLLDMLEDIAEEVAKLVGPSKAKILARLWRLIPPWIRARIEAVLAGIVGKILQAIGRVMDKIKRLPPPTP